jgi:hypothetical protein
VETSDIAGRRLGLVHRRLRKPQTSPYFVRALESHGLVVSEVADHEVEAGMHDILWIQGNINWYPRIRRTLAAVAPAQRPFVIAWHTEPLPLPRASGVRAPLPNLRELAKIVTRDTRATDVRTNARRLRQMKRRGIPDLLVVSTASRQAFLAENGIESHFVPLGYSPSSGRDLGLERDIDALFVGVMSDPRHRRAARSVRAKGIDLVARGGWTLAGGLWGDERLETINRARTFLGFQRNPGELSGMRMLLGMACRSLVISEPIVSPEPYVPGTHYASVTLADMPEAIRYYIDNDAERARIADAGHRFVTTELTLERSVSKILELAGLA